MPDRRAGRGQRPTGSPCATPRSRPHRDGCTTRPRATDGSPPCFLSDISGWSLSLVRSPPAGRRRRFRFSECRIGAPGELSDLRGRRAQHPDRDRTEMGAPHARERQMGLRRAFSISFRAGLYPLSGRRLLAAVADSVLANAGSARRASSATYGVAVRNTPIATAPRWVHHTPASDRWVSAVLSL